MLEFDASSFLPEMPIPGIIKHMIKASGKSRVHNLPVCVKGDETEVKKPHNYNNPSFPIPGTGTFEILALGPDQTTKKTFDNNKPIITKGSTFEAIYKINGKAILPTPKGPEDDKSPMYTGKGKFVELVNTDVYAG